jgi:hypothetical protein
MRPWTSFELLRTHWLAVVVGLGLCTVSVVGDAAPLPPGAGRTTIVDCALGQKISPRLTTSRSAVIVKGTCTENVFVGVDDVSILTDGVTPATIQPADPGQPAMLFEGARRVVVDGGAPGLTINGGTFGIAATRGAAVDVKNCVVTNTSGTGVLASYSSSLVVDNCTITGNAGNGGVAANASSLVVTNSTVTSNTLIGLGAVRGSYLRVGQDTGGTPVLKPVTVSASGTNGVLITEGSSGTLVGGTIQTSGSTNVFVGRASSGQIGVGINGLTGGVTIQNGSRDGVFVEGANVTLVFSTISGNALRGVVVANGGSGRIGLLNGSTGYGPTTISGHGSSGIGVISGGAAWIGGTTVQGNGTAVGTNLGRFGVNVHHATATLVGNNVIENNAETGVFVSAGSAVIGDAGFGLATTNTISGNGVGVTPTNNGGIFAFEGAVIRVNDATIFNNTGPAVQAFERGTIELRGNTAVTVPAAGVTTGAVVQFGSTLRLRDNASIVSATGDGIQASNLTAVNVRDPTSVVQGNGAGRFGVSCFSLGNEVAESAATLTGTLTNVSGNAGAVHPLCNTFPGVPQ